MKKHIKGIIVGRMVDITTEQTVGVVYADIFKTGDFDFALGAVKTDGIERVEALNGVVEVTPDGLNFDGCKAGDAISKREYDLKLQCVIDYPIPFLILYDKMGDYNKETGQCEVNKSWGYFLYKGDSFIEWEIQKSWGYFLYRGDSFIDSDTPLEEKECASLAIPNPRRSFNAYHTSVFGPEEVKYLVKKLKQPHLAVGVSQFGYTTGFGSTRVTAYSDATSGVFYCIGLIHPTNQYGDADFSIFERVKIEAEEKIDAEVKRILLPTSNGREIVWERDKHMEPMTCVELFKSAWNDAGIEQSFLLMLLLIGAKEYAGEISGRTVAYTLKRAFWIDRKDGDGDIPVYLDTACGGFGRYKYSVSTEGEQAYQDLKDILVQMSKDKDYWASLISLGGNVQPMDASARKAYDTIRAYSLTGEYESFLLNYRDALIKAYQNKTAE